MLRFTSGYKTTDQSPHHHLLEAQQLGLVHDGEGEAAGEQRDAEEDQHGPEVADLSRLLPTVQTRGPAPTCRDWDLTMNLYLSTAMAMLVREDMYTVTHGKVFTNLGSNMVGVAMSDYKKWMILNFLHFDKIKLYHVTF